MRLSGLSLCLDTYLLAGVFDFLHWLVWSKTVDGEKNQNRPASMIDMLTGNKNKEQDELETFRTSEDFVKAWQQIVGGENDSN